MVDGMDWRGPLAGKVQRLGQLGGDPLREVLAGSLVGGLHLGGCLCLSCPSKAASPKPCPGLDGVGIRG